MRLTIQELGVGRNGVSNLLAHAPVLLLSEILEQLVLKDLLSLRGGLGPQLPLILKGIAPEENHGHRPHLLLSKKKENHFGEQPAQRRTKSGETAYRNQGGGLGDIEKLGKKDIRLGSGLKKGPLSLTTNIIIRVGELGDEVLK